jgi:superoxide dismutase, Fe-Mn family
MREHIDLIEASTKPAKLETVPLPYKKNELEPVMSEATIDYHYENLARGYAERYNKDNSNSGGDYVKDFNRAGNFLHNTFFPQFRAPRSPNRPKGASLQLIEQVHGDFDALKQVIKEEAMKIQGSGWVYMSTSGDIKTIKNHAVRTDIALLIDWWEHSWAIDYQADKAKYLENIWKIINWDVVNQRL